MAVSLKHIQDACFDQLMPYRAFDPDTQVFVNSRSLMTVLECPLLTGGNDVLTKSLTQAFNAVTLSELMITVRRVTHARVEDRLEAIMQDLAQGGGMLIDVAEKERAYYQRACRQGLLVSGGERKPMLDSRVFLELSVHCGASQQAKLMQQSLPNRRAKRSWVVRGRLRFARQPVGMRGKSLCSRRAI